MRNRPLSRLGTSSITSAVFLAASLSSGCGAPAEPEGPVSTSEKRHPSYRRARVVVADEVSGKLSVFDIEENAWIAAIEMDGPTKLFASESGDFATLVSSNKDQVGFLRGGVAVAPHDDHIHIYKFPPSVHDFELSGASPNAVVSNARKIGVFFDGIGDASVVVEQELIPRGDAPIPTTYSAGEKHMGVAIPMTTGVLLTNPMILDPIGGRAHSMVFARDAERIEIATDCPSIEGSVGLGDQAAMACADGVLVVSVGANGGNVTGKKWVYPGAERAKTLQGHAPRGFVAGNLGSNALFRLDVNTGETRRIDVDAEVCGYALEPSKAESIVALTTDGHLHLFDIETGHTTTLVDAVPPFACNALDTQSQLALTPDRVFVTVPSAGEVLEIGFDPFALRQRHVVGGAPSNIVVLGLDAANIDVELGTH